MNLSDAKGPFKLTLISIDIGRITETTSAKLYGRTEKIVQGGNVVTMKVPYKRDWIATLVKK